MIVLGGIDSKSRYLNDVWIYDLSILLSIIKPLLNGL